VEIIASQAIGCFYIGFMHSMSGHSKGPRKVPNREPTVPVQPTVIALPRPAKRVQVRAWVAALVLPAALAGAAAPVHAVDGCLVLLDRMFGSLASTHTSPAWVWDVSQGAMPALPPPRPSPVAA
jgi:hypothetical protein